MAKATRPIRIEGDVAYIPLTQGYEAVIDATDVPIVEGYSWSLAKSKRKDGSIRTLYARRHVRVGAKVETVQLHRQILDTAPGVEGEHRDGDGLNNRRANLRPATRSQNACNRGAMPSSKSGVKGVYWQKSVGKWHARINIGRKVHYLGLFRCVTAAAVAYAKASRELHGEFGRTA